MSVIVRLENIGVFRGVREFRLGRGLNLVYAPNASGKSSLIAGLKAVSIPTLSRQELARVLNDYEERGSIVLRIGDEEYIVDLKRISQTEAEASGRRLSGNGVVRAVAFLDLENPIVNAIYAGDEARLKQILRDVSGVGYIETIVSVLEGLVAEYEHQYEVKSKEYEARKREVEEQLSGIEAELHRIDNRINEILKDSRVEPARIEIERIEREMKELEEQVNMRRSEEIDLRNKLSDIEREEGLRKPELDLLKEKLSKLLEERNMLKSRMMEYRRKVEELDAKIETLKTERSRLEDERRGLRQLLERRESVALYDYCPYCGALIEKDRLHKDIDDLRARISEISNRILTLENEIRLLESEKSMLKRDVEERLQNIEKEINDTDSKIKGLQRILESYSKARSSINRRLEAIEGELKMLRDKLELLMKQYDHFKNQVPLVDELRKLHEERLRLSEIRDRLHGRVRQLEVFYKDVVELGRRVSITKLLSEYFRARLVELGRTAVERVNEAIARHFELLRLAELEHPVFAEGFELRLARRGGVATALAELSDAEKAILAILLTLSLKEHIASDFPLYAVDTLVEFIDDTRAREVIKYLADFASKTDTVAVVAKTKPYTGEPRLLSQEDIMTNQITFPQQ
jgi:DNA repair exonuclease SbcCD ATPase subunit